MFEIKKAKRSRRPLKVCLEGLSGTGKTFTALRLAFQLKRAGIGRKIVIADSENESAGLYDGITEDGERWEYDVVSIPAESRNPAGYVEVYEYLVGEGYDLIIMDSLTHAWHGALEQVDAHARRNKGDKFGGWALATPDQRRMLSTLTDPRAHLIATMRVKGEYERITDSNNKTTIKKVGMKTDQREGSEYEFDCVVRIDQGHEASVDKVRGCREMDGRRATCPGPGFWKPLLDWWLSAPIAEPTIAEQFARAAEEGFARAVADADSTETLRGVVTRINAEIVAGRIVNGARQRLLDLVAARKAVLSVAGSVSV